LTVALLKPDDLAAFGRKGKLDRAITDRDVIIKAAGSAGR